MSFLGRQLLLETMTHFGVMVWQRKVKPEDVAEVIEALSRNKAVILRGMTDVASKRKTTSDVVESLTRRVQNNEPDMLLHRMAS
ncbi:MAG: hypothetical protein AAB594_01345 [Patescibacteria group bacterium]|mgnify:CR=1 FL=1